MVFSKMFEPEGKTFSIDWNIGNVQRHWCGSITLMQNRSKADYGFSGSSGKQAVEWQSPQKVQ